MSMLVYYMRRVADTRGLEHQLNLATLRNYLKTTPIDQLIDHIRDIGDTRYLRTLWEAGLTSELQGAVLRRYEELTERRR